MRYRRQKTEEERMTMCGSRDFQQGDIWGDGDDINTGTHDGGLENG